MSIVVLYEHNRLSDNIVPWSTMVSVKKSNRFLYQALNNNGERYWWLSLNGDMILLGHLVQNSNTSTRYWWFSLIIGMIVLGHLVPNYLANQTYQCIFQILMFCLCFIFSHQIYFFPRLYYYINCNIFEFSIQL